MSVTGEVLTSSITVFIRNGGRLGCRARKDQLARVQRNAAPITIARQAHGSRIEVGAPVSLFQTLMVGDGASTVTTRYAVSRDGRFLISQPAESATTPITLILNWKAPA